MGTRNASMQTQFNGEKPVFVSDPDSLQPTLDRYKAPEFYRELQLERMGAVFARGQRSSVFGFTVAKQFSAYGLSAPKGDGKHPGAQDMAVMVLPDLLTRGASLYYVAQGSEDAFQECLGSVNGYSTVGRSGVTKAENGNGGYAFVENPDNDASIAVYQRGATLSDKQVFQAFQEGLLQPDILKRIGLDTRSAEEQAQDDATQAAQTDRQREQDRRRQQQDDKDRQAQRQAQRERQKQQREDYLQQLEDNRAFQERLQDAQGDDFDGGGFGDFGGFDEGGGLFGGGGGLFGGGLFGGGGGGGGDDGTGRGPGHF